MEVHRELRPTMPTWKSKVLDKIRGVSGLEATAPSEATVASNSFESYSAAFLATPSRTRIRVMTAMMDSKVWNSV